MNPVLSIIIPFFDKADKRLLDRCLNSVYNQGVEADLFEIIIPDDDGKGVAYARNKGIESAKGEYLFFVDADDFLFPDTLQICINMLLEHQPDMLSFQFKKVKGKQRATSVKQPDLSINHAVYGPQYMLHHNFFGAVWRFIIRKKLITENDLLFFQRKHHEDEPFCALAYFFSRKVIDISLFVYAYCTQENSLMTHKGKQQRQERIDDFYYILSALATFNKSDCAIHSIQTKALERRIRFLTVDFLIQLYRNRCSIAEFKHYIGKLKEEQFLPLPDNRYSFKYNLARLLINRF